MVGTVVKAKVDDLEDEVSEGFFRIMREYFTSSLQVVSGNMRFLVRFQYGYEKYLTLNQLTAVAVDKIPVTEEDEVPMIYEIPYDKFDLDKRYYYGSYILLKFNK